MFSNKHSCRTSCTGLRVHTPFLEGLTSRASRLTRSSVIRVGRLHTIGAQSSRIRVHWVTVRGAQGLASHKVAKQQPHVHPKPQPMAPGARGCMGLAPAQRFTLLMSSRSFVVGQDGRSHSLHVQPVKKRVDALQPHKKHYQAPSEAEEIRHRTLHRGGVGFTYRPGKPRVTLFRFGSCRATTDPPWF